MRWRRAAAPAQARRGWSRCRKEGVGLGRLKALWRAISDETVNWEITVKTTPYGDREPTGFTADVLHEIQSREFSTTFDLQKSLAGRWPGSDQGRLSRRILNALATLKRQGRVRSCSLGGQQLAWFDPSHTSAAELAERLQSAEQQHNAAFSIMTDDQWRVVEPLLVGSVGKKFSSGRRRFIDGLLYLAKKGLPWTELPKSYGDAQRAHQRFIRWASAGVWVRVLDAMADSWDREIIESIKLRARIWSDQHDRS